MDKDNQGIAIEIAQKNGFDIRDVRELLDCDTSPEETVRILKEKEELAEQKLKNEALKDEQDRRLEQERQELEDAYRGVAAEEWHTSYGRLNDSMKKVLKIWGATLCVIGSCVSFAIAFGGAFGSIMASCAVRGPLSIVFGAMMVPCMAAGAIGFTICCHIDDDVVVEIIAMPKWLFRRIMRSCWRRVFINSEPSDEDKSILLSCGMKERAATRLIKKRQKKFKMMTEIKEQKTLRQKIVEKYCEITIPDWFEQKRTRCYEVYESATQSVENFERRKIFFWAIIILYGGGILFAFVLWLTTSDFAVAGLIMAASSAATVVTVIGSDATIHHIRRIRLWLDKKENPMFENFVKSSIRQKILYGKRDSEEEAVAQELPAP